VLPQARMNWAIIEKRGHNQGARVVVRGIAFARIGHCEDRMLEDSSVIGQGEQMTRVEPRQAVRRIPPRSACVVALGCDMRSWRAR
jgi:hypothetical protein